jgi:formylglycine-generating enzyme required for sulfatase activity
METRMRIARCLLGYVIGSFFLSAMVLAEVDPVELPDRITLRIPGTTVPFDMVLCTEGSINLEPEDARSQDDPETIVIASCYVLTTEVTWDLYDIYVYELDEPDVSRPSKPYIPPDRGFGHDGYPAIGMTYQAAKGFCEWLSLKTGLEIRLPTASEWTFLAVGESLDAYCCETNTETLSKVAWFAANAQHSTHSVGEKLPNASGLFDMHGNAAEWVENDARKPFAMGGGFRDSAEECTATSMQQQLRSWNTSDPQIPKSSWWLADCSWVGFRFVISVNSVNLATLEDLIHE